LVLRVHQHNYHVQNYKYLHSAINVEKEGNEMCIYFRELSFLFLL